MIGLKMIVEEIGFIWVLGVKKKFPIRVLLRNGLYLIIIQLVASMD